AAAQGWGVDPAALRTESGRVIHDATGRAIAYGALAGRAAGQKPPADPPLKDPKAFRLIGKPLKRVDTPEKVNGLALDGIDALPDGVKFATFAHAPVVGGKVVKVDDSQALAARITGLPLDKVTVHQHLLGGGFGRRLEFDPVTKAVRIAQHVDGPVKVVWTREEDIRHDVYRPAWHDRLSARLEGGRIAA